MAAIKLRILVNELSNVMLVFDQIKVYRSTTGMDGTYAEITDAGTRIDLVADTTLYEYIDTAGAPSYWYKFAYWDSTGAEEGTASAPIQGEGVDGMYCTLADIRDEGFAEATYSDARVLLAIELAARYVEMYTGRWFEPRTRTFTLDGSGQPSLLLEHPIISVSEVVLDDDTLEADDFVAYNRHISEGLLNPDDRDNPRLEIAQPRPDDLLFKYGLKVWTRGQRNVQVTGVFGYTDYDGTAQGKTPDLITHAAKLLVVRNLTPLSDQEGRDDATRGWRVTEHKTRDQAIRFGAAVKSSLGRAGVGMFTGDPEIDTILLRYRRQPTMRAV